MENEQSTVPVSRHLQIGIATIGFAIVCIAAVFVLEWEWACSLWLLMSAALLYGWISVLRGLSLMPNRRGFRHWTHIGILLIIPILLLLGNYFRLLDVRTRLAVAVTGGQDELQTWAVAVLGKPRDRMHSDGEQWTVPEEDWSEQVRRLKPGRVYIRAVFENGGEGVCLPYGGGFFHWWIVIGRPGSRPDPRFNGPSHDEWWLRWGDGIYDWQQG
jgi:hypothetical protein